MPSHPETLEANQLDEEPEGARRSYAGTFDELLSPEERDRLESMRAKIDEERERAQLEGEVTYERAVKKEASDGVEAAANDYAAAARLLINAAADDIALSTREEPRVPNPVQYLKISDALTKQAETVDEDELMNDTEGRPTNAHDYLSAKAVKFWDKGIDLLLNADSQPVELHVPDNPARFVATAVAKAAKDIDETQEYDVLGDTAETELAEQLEAGGAKEIKSLVSRRLKKEQALQVVGLSSTILQGRLTDFYSHEFSLT